ETLRNFFCSSRRRHTRFSRDWSSDVCSSDLIRVGIIIDNIANKAGTERAVSSLCNGLMKFFPNRYEITIISIFSTKNQTSFFEQIGRASCRERVVIAAGAQSYKIKKAQGTRG